MNGVIKINSVIYKFRKLINALEDGINLIDEKQCSNKNLISDLTTENSTLEAPKRNAITIATNLRKLLGVEEN